MKNPLNAKITSKLIHVFRGCKLANEQLIVFPTKYTKIRTM